MLELINQERVKAGVPEVALGDNIAAQLHAESSLANCAAAHWDVDGLKPYMRYSLAGGARYSAENISGIDYCITASDGQPVLASIESAIQATMDGWMRSPEHKRNILDPWHELVNIGLAWDRYNRVFVQQFEYGDYTRYYLSSSSRMPFQIRGPFLSVNLALKTELRHGSRFSQKEDVRLNLYYDPPPQALTQGQLARTYCYDNGQLIAAFAYTLPSGWYWSGPTTIEVPQPENPCPDPYAISPDAPAPRSVGEALELFDAAKNRPPPATPLPPVVAKWRNTQDWTITVFHTETDGQLVGVEIEAFIRDMLEEYGPGVYTIELYGLVFGDWVPVSRYSMFHEVAPPDTFGSGYCWYCSNAGQSRSRWLDELRQREGG